MRHVDLCSGIGGFSLGFEWAGLSKPILFCDVEPWCRRVLSKHWPDVPVASDVKELANDPDRNVPDCDILTAGYPCQPFSLAGERRGTEDDRHIWPYILSIIQAKRPAWCVFENVYGHVSMGLDEVLSDLEGEGYAARPFIVPACAADAPHRRDRVWIIARNVGDTRRRSSKSRWDTEAREKAFWCASSSVNKRSGKDVAYPISSGSQARDRDGMGDDHGSCGNQEQSPRSGSESNVAHAASERLQGAEWPKYEGNGNGFAASSKDVADTQRQRQQGQRSQGDAINQETHGEGQAAQPFNGGVGGFWLPEPAVGRVANGIPRRVDRLRGLGNAIVPQIAMRIGETIKAVEMQDGR